ncbi:putative dna-directed rna polymerase [Diplodia seriata]|uniref:Putative dna-directed rna polymerase n=1 Tax=Diplodia seriata TaxID=420778 RepID=A0A0G2GN91_9PEZI|nr:putative dna-directed rna polymerase [Diplodia seriata]
MFSQSVLAATALALVSSCNAHMILSSPVPYGLDSLTNSPLDNSGSDFPCKQRSGVYDISEMNNMKVGESQTLSFKGGATHGGGSCQVSVTLDAKPTKDSQWKVIHSIIGGCPTSEAGNLSGDSSYDGATKFNYTVPEGMPNGEYTLAWTWFNKIGNREMYMNCAPITVSGGADNNDVYDKLPDMFVANLPRESCEVPDSMNMVFPNPGDSVETAESSALATSLQGSGCASVTKLGAGAGKAGTAAEATGAASGAAGASTPVSTPAASTPAAGGVFAPGAASGSYTATSMVSVVVTQSAAGAATTPAASPATPAAAAGTPASSSGDCTSCSSNGSVVCIGSDSFGICNNGCAVKQSLASGTTCSNGTISKRDTSKVHKDSHRKAHARALARAARSLIHKQSV